MSFGDETTAFRRFIPVRFHFFTPIVDDWTARLIL